MGVARNGEAWIQLRPNAKVSRVNTLKDNECKDSGLLPGTKRFKFFGLTFVGIPGDPRCDQLYIHNFDDNEWSEEKNSGQLSRIDDQCLEVETPASSDFNGGELTGTKMDVSSRLLELRPQNSWSTMQ